MGQRDDRFRVQAVFPVLAFGDVVGFLLSEQRIVQPHFGIDGVLGADPVQRSFDFAAIGGLATRGLWIVSAAQFNHVAIVVFDTRIAFDEIGVLESDFFANSQSEKLLRRVFHKVGSLDVQLPAKGHFTDACRFVFRIVGGLAHLRLAFGVIFNHDFDWIQHRHGAIGRMIQMVANAKFQQRNLGQAIEFGDTDFVTEGP